MPKSATNQSAVARGVRAAPGAQRHSTEARVRFGAAKRTDVGVTARVRPMLQPSGTPVMAAAPPPGDSKPASAARPPARRSR
jgi:hypothetical protein